MYLFLQGKSDFVKTKPQQCFRNGILSSLGAPGFTGRRTMVRGHVDSMNCHHQLFPDVVDDESEEMEFGFVIGIASILRVRPAETRESPTRRMSACLARTVRFETPE
jgi:hypothetical protein